MNRTSDFFNKDEIVTYSDINDLSKKIKKYSIDDELRQKIAKKGRNKYFKFFNSTGWDIWENISIISIHDHFVLAQAMLELSFILLMRRECSALEVMNSFLYT